MLFIDQLLLENNKIKLSFYEKDSVTNGKSKRYRV